jgi:hypothetical protein
MHAQAFAEVLAFCFTTNCKNTIQDSRAAQVAWTIVNINLHTLPHAHD